MESPFTKLGNEWRGRRLVLSLAKETRTRDLCRDRLGVYVLSATYILAGAAKSLKTTVGNRSLWVNLWVRIVRPKMLLEVWNGAPNRSRPEMEEANGIDPPPVRMKTRWSRAESRCCSLIARQRENAKSQ